MPNNIIDSFARKSGKPQGEVEKLWDEAKSKVKVSEEDPKYYPEVVSILKNMLHLNEDGEGGGSTTAGSTVSTGIAILPGSGGKPQEREKYNGYDVFETDLHNFTSAATARTLRQKYNFTDKSINDHLKKTDWKKPFYLRYQGHYTKVN